MASCSSTNVNSIVSKPQEDLLTECVKISKDGDLSTFGGVWLKLDEVTDQYIICAKRHNALVDFIRKQK